MAVNDPLLEGIIALHRSLAESEPLPESLDRIARVAVGTVPGADLAGVTVLQDGEPLTVAYRGKEALELDDSQYEAGDGPCLHAFRAGEVVRVDFISDDPRWPHFAEGAANHGVKSSLSMPLIIDGQGIGALNLYGRSPSAFADAEEQAGTFAEQAAIVIKTALALLQTQELVAQMEEALQSRDVIGQAKGVLMAQQRITAEAAFTELRHASNDLNRKLRDVAEEVASTGSLPGRDS